MRLDGSRQWRGGGRRATAAGSFSQRFCRGFVESFAGLTVPNESNASGPSESAFQQGFNALVEFLEALFALDHLAIDEKGRRRIDLQHIGGELLIAGDLVEQRLILEAFLDGLLAQSGLQADPGQRLRGVL